MNKSKGKRGGFRKGAGAKKDLTRTELGREINLAIQGMPRYAAEQIVQHLLDGDREKALGLVRNMILVAHRKEVAQLAEECARLLAPYPDLWLRPPPAASRDAQAPVPSAKEREDATRRAADLLRQIAAFVNRQVASTVVNYSFTKWPLKPRGKVIMDDYLRLAAVCAVKKKAEEERLYWKTVFELNEKRRLGTLTQEDHDNLDAITPENLPDW